MQRRNDTRRRFYISAITRILDEGFYGATNKAPVDMRDSRTESLTDLTLGYRITRKRGSCGVGSGIPKVFGPPVTVGGHPNYTSVRRWRLSQGARPPRSHGGVSRTRSGGGV